MELDPSVVAIIQRLAIFFPCFLLALTFHEFSHAWMASRFGDQTAAWQGRLTLNPAAHIDPIGTILFPLVSVVTGFMLMGWAKPVPTDPRNYTNYRSGTFWVAFAGPLSNFGLGIIAAFMYVASAVFLPESFGYRGALVQFAEAFVYMNFMLGIFNLIPLPPLDGSHMLLTFLSPGAQQQVYRVWDYSFYILFFLILTGAFRIIAVPIEYMSKAAIYFAAVVFGLS